MSGLTAAFSATPPLETRTWREYRVIFGSKRNRNNSFVQEVWKTSESYNSGAACLTAGR